MRQFFDRYIYNPHWRTIKIFGHAKVLGISATTIIVAPLLSRILIKLNEMETSIRQAHPALDALFPLIKYHLELPLSIKFLVGSAVCALVGKGIYEMGCPVYIKEGDTYEQFRHSQARATDALVGGLLKIAHGIDIEKKDAMVMGLQALKVSLKATDISGTQPLEASSAINLVFDGRTTRSGPVARVLRFPEIGEAFYYVLRDVMDDSRRATRVTCAVLYLSAFVLLFFTLVLQLGWAVRGVLI